MPQRWRLGRLPRGCVLRILQIAPPWFSIPPVGYGGTEAVVSLLTEGLVAAGHYVELVASGGTVTRARLRIVYRHPPTERLGDVGTELAHVLEALAGAGDVDLIHDHSGLLGAALGASVAADGPPVLHTLHGAWTDTTRRVYRHLADRIGLVAISQDQAQRRPAGLPIAGVVHNAIDLRAHPYAATSPGEHLAWVGRATPDKGPLEAIEVARRLGRRLVLCIKVNEAEEHVYFREVLEPALVGADVEVRFDAHLAVKVGVLQRARCLLFPIRWAEPFGLVMVEAMSCGTPVVGFANGAAPEVVRDGETGYLVPDGDLDALADAVEAVGAIDRRACRDHVEAAFSPERLVRDHLALYERVVADRTVGVGTVAS
jgi:glycosyltransferase involved in cell wall biosynthesis